MKRGKIKSKVVKATLANKDVLDMFQGVLGTSEGGASLAITHPKYLRIREHVHRFLTVLGCLRDSELLKLFPEANASLSAYSAALWKQSADSFNAPDLEPYLRPATVVETPSAAAAAEEYSRVPPEVASQFSAAFAACKKCSLVNLVIVTCTNLVAHKKSLGDAKRLRDFFLTKGGGLAFTPLPDLPQVNFKQIYIDDRLAADDRQYILIVLHKLYTTSHDTYEALSAPDINVDDFVEVIMSSIGEVRKHIPRCDQAFDKIIESVDLLKGNFGGYYKDFVASNNPTIIMENFVLDVSKNTKSSPTVTGQFRQIIMHYKKLAATQTTNPKMRSLFQQVDANFQELEKKNKAADAAESDEDSASDGERPGAAGDRADASPTLAEGLEPAGAAAARTTTAQNTPPAEAKISKKGGKKARRRRNKAAASVGTDPLGDSQKGLFEELGGLDGDMAPGQVESDPSSEPA